MSKKSFGATPGEEVGRACGTVAECWPFNYELWVWGLLSVRVIKISLVQNLVELRLPRSNGILINHTQQSYSELSSLFSIILYHACDGVLLARILRHTLCLFRKLLHRERQPEVPWKRREIGTRGCASGARETGPSSSLPVPWAPSSVRCRPWRRQSRWNLYARIKITLIE